MKNLLLTAILLGVALSASASQLGQPLRLARADHADGNMPSGVWPNYWLVEQGQLRVCDNSQRVTTQVLESAIAIWSNGIGASIDPLTGRSRSATITAVEPG